MHTLIHTPGVNTDENPNKPNKATLKLLEKGKIHLWQACLRDKIALKDYPVKIKSKKILEQILQTPACAPKWAGGRDEKPIGRPKEWRDDEVWHVAKGIKEGILLPYEVAILYRRRGEQVQKTLNEINLVPDKACPPWVPDWARCWRLSPSENYSHLHGENFLDTKGKTKGSKKSTKGKGHPSVSIDPKTGLRIGPWSELELRNLRCYWKLELLGSQEIAHLLNRDLQETIQAAQSLKLPTKMESSEKQWCGINWQFELGGTGDPKLLDAHTQRLVAEASATRFSLLYETLDNIQESSKAYRNIQRELDKIIELHHRIFDKYLAVKSRKYNMGPSTWLAQEDLQQAGKTAIFECLRRWHPERNIRFSRGAVCVAIMREMIAWIEQQRLIELPDKIRSVARKLRQAKESGNFENEYRRLCSEAGESCVKEASKHQNTYAYVSTVQFMDSYEEDTAETGGVQSATADCMEGFQTWEDAPSNIDLGDLLISATRRLSDEERRAVLAYHGINEDGTHGVAQTLEEIGAMEGVTKERIRQRIVKGKERMKRWLESKNIRNVTDAMHGV